MGELAHRIYVKDLTLDEKAEYQRICFEGYANKSKSISKISRETGLTIGAVKNFIDEAAAWERNNRPDTKTANISAYRSFIEHCMEVIENPEGHSALVVAKCHEGILSALTRLDKLGGHEAPTVSVGVSGETAADLIRQYVSEFNASPADISKLDDDTLLSDSAAEQEPPVETIVDEYGVYIPDEEDGK